MTTLIKYNKKFLTVLFLVLEYIFRKIKTMMVQQGLIIPSREVWSWLEATPRTSVSLIFTPELYL